jgi:hypothetical protein
MGLFNFFKKGPAAKDTDELQVKGTAYDTTARALPPIRGTIHGKKEPSQDTFSYIGNVLLTCD